MNVIAIVGLETIKDSKGNVKYYADTFMNNIRTWQKDNPKDKIKVLDGRDYVCAKTPLSVLWEDIANAFDGIDLILYSGHSDNEKLYWLSKTRPDLDPTEKFIENNEWPFKFNEDASIKIMGCQAGGQDGKKWPVCIAQTIANKSGVTVWAFTCKSSQKKRKGGYYQIPDTGDYVKFVKEV
jgi:hypothetical protein